MLCRCRGRLALQSTGKCSDLLRLTVLALLPEALGPPLSGSCLQSILGDQSLPALAVLALLPEVLSLDTITYFAGRVILNFAHCQGSLKSRLSPVISASCTAAHACRHTGTKSTAEECHFGQMPQL